MSNEQSRSRSDAPLYADSFGYALALKVLQSDLYATLDGWEKAECDELIARGLAKQPPAPPTPPQSRIVRGGLIIRSETAQWVSVNDRLPPLGTDCECRGVFDNIWRVTHWRTR